MGVPRDNRDPWVRLKDIEDRLDKVRGDLARVGLDPSGNSIFLADNETGILKPRLAATMTTPSQNITITSATYVEAFTVAGRRQNAT